MEKKIKNGSINSSEGLCEYLINKSQNHNNYKYYAPKEYIDDILKNHCLYFSDGNNWNDVVDKNAFNNDESEYLNFGLCLSYSRSENVAMWMLYSGNNGCMIDYEKDLIKNVISTKQIVLGCFSNEGFIEKQFLNDNFYIKMIDVIYYGESKFGDDYYYVKRSEETNNKFKKQIIDNLNQCKKTIAWSYDNECRIMLLYLKILYLQLLHMLKLNLTRIMSQICIHVPMIHLI